MRRPPKKNHDNKCPTSSWLLTLGVLVGYLCQGMCQEPVARRVRVVVGDRSEDPEQYPGQLATFGNQAPELLFAPELNLVLPPERHTHLCDYPVEATSTGSKSDTQHPHLDYNVSSEVSAGRNNTNNSTPYMVMEDEDDGHLIARDSERVALFVSYGECLPFQKAKMALALQRNFTRFGTVTHLLIYNHDFSNMDELHTLETYMKEEDLSGISIIFVSTRTGRDIMENIRAVERRERLASPLLFNDGNEFWYLPVSFLEPPAHEPPISGSGTSGGTGIGFSDIDPYSDNFDNNQYPPPLRQETGLPEADDFYWFRLVVFSLLVVSPCFRAAYLWYAGGARIRFRYNGRGRIVGLQYIPPMPYWFAPRPDENYTQPATRMTREQVMALPEIVFRATETEEAEQPINSNNDNQQKEESEPKDAVGGSGGLEKPATGRRDFHETSSIAGSITDLSGNTTPLAASSEGGDLPSISLDADEEHGSPVFASELHSTCSICIDDFEHGEQLRMLPRCGHVFHTGKRIEVTLGHVGRHSRGVLTHLLNLLCRRLYPTMVDRTPRLLPFV